MRINSGQMSLSPCCYIALDPFDDRSIPRSIRHVDVFYQRAAELAREGELELGTVLGHAIAHEIGHLLLGSNAHGPRGLMRAKWGPRDLQGASKGYLLFGQKEAELIRANVAARLRLRDRWSATRG
jgi:hypothetical protein